MLKERFGSCAAALFLAAAAVGAAEIPGASPDEFRISPALPSTTDLVRFDNSAPAAPARFDARGANQGAFPAHYGSTPPAAAAAGLPPATAFAAPAPAGEADGSGLIPGGTANLLSREMAGQVGQAAPPQPPAAGVTRIASAATGDARFAQPAAPPNSVAAWPAPTDSSGAVGSAGAGGNGVMTAVPVFTPILPELSPVSAPPAPPVDINLLMADFNRLKAFCDEDNLGSAAEVYAGMPDFGADAEANRLRADAANLLILGLARTDNLSAARRIYESVPVGLAGDAAALAKARGVINLATYYVRAERYSDAYDVLMDVGGIPNRSALNVELFRLMARMIPYLDNADQTDKASAVFDLLLAEVNSAAAAALFAENAPGVFKYYLHYVDKSESPRNRRLRLDFLEHAFAAMERLSGNADVRLARKTLGESLAARYAGDPERAARFYTED